MAAEAILLGLQGGKFPEGLQVFNREFEPGILPPARQELTLLLREWHAGDEGVVRRIFPVVYDELRRLAARQMKAERPDHTLSPTALVNEAYLKLLGADVEWQDRVHFFAISSSVMRRILVDHARAKLSQKRGGNEIHLQLDDSLIGSDLALEQLLDLDEAIRRLNAASPRIGRTVELHYFGGMEYDEIAAVLEVSRSTITRDLRFAKVWLQKELRER